MRARVAGILIGLILGVAGGAAAQMPGPVPSPDTMAPDTPPDDVQMGRTCTVMMGPMMSAGGMMGMSGAGMMGGMMSAVWVWGVQALLFWGLFLVLVVPVIALLLRSRPGTPEALSLLQVRFARGEVSPEEYEQRRRLLLADR